MNETISEIADRRKHLYDSISSTCADSGRTKDAVQLVAVSKRQDMAKIHAALVAGQRVFGENQVAEAETHWSALKPQYPDLRLHLIGHLQSNKADRAVALFDVIETLDSLKLASALQKAMMAQARQPDVWIQVNTGEEDQKHGIVPRDLPDFLAALGAQTNIQPSGLMCIPPRNEEPGLHFALLAKIAARHGLENVSMGMSGDYETAIRFGATHVRVGTGFFGERVV